MSREGARTLPAPEVPIPEGQSVGPSLEPGLTRSWDCSLWQGHPVRSEGDPETPPGGVSCNPPPPTDLDPP